MSMSTAPIPEMRCTYSEDDARHPVHADVPTAALNTLRAQADTCTLTLEEYIGITLIAHANTITMDLMFPHSAHDGDMAPTPHT